ncbi:MAG: hypothetical protein AB1598_12660 [Thermodesulfobacteriota bacterium]
MNTLVTAFLIQLALSAILFAMLYYLIAANTRLKKEIEAERLKGPTKS